MRVIIAFLFIGIAQAYCPVNSTCTEVYTKRFETIPIIFNSTIGVDAQQNLVINISFSDNYTDPTTNIDNNYSCIYKPTIVSTYNDQTGYRTWSYFISPANFQTELIAGTSSQALLNYAGYFGIEFTAVGVVKYIYQYNFTIQVNRQTFATATTSFYQNFKKNFIQFIPEVIFNTCSLLQFCTTQNCETPSSTINLTLYSKFWLLITNIKFNQYLLKNPTIALSSENSLFRVYNPIATSVNATAGKTIIPITIDFAYQNVVIGVSAQLFPPGTRRILQESTNPTSLQMTATSDSIDCIKYSTKNQTCVSCSDQCKINNGIASPSCPKCDASNMNSALLSIAMILILITTY